MCGIAGMGLAPGNGPPQFDVLRRMVAVLAHRGPDGHGLYRDGRVGLAHARLSLLDLQGGHQPLANEDGSVLVVGNGEIFGHLALRDELRRAGHVFRTRCDIEVIVHAYEQWGEGAWPRLDGQFAFALYDARTGQLWLVRDRLGILPLFYAERPEGVVFGSEVKALLASGHVPVTFDAAGLVAAFTLWAAPAPRTVFAGVQSVRPGEAVRFDRDLAARRTTWWRPELRPGAGAGSFAADVDALAAELDRAVATRLVADVPVATYLSGGLDSSVITALAAPRASALHTFSLRFTDPAYDETAAQRRVAAWLGTQHHEVLCSEADVRANLAEVVWHCETPLLRTAPVPMFLLSGLVARTGIKAVLTGEGADELLGGYSIFQEDRVRRFWARAPGSTVRPALFQRVHEFVGSSDQRSGAMWQAFYAAGLQDVGHPHYSHAIRWRNNAWTARFLAPDLRAAAGSDPGAAVEALLPADFARGSPLCRAQALEIASFLSPYLLGAQGDRVALGHGVEARYPFLDPAVVDLCAALPDARKLRGLRNKLVLRALGARLLPADVWRRKKQPYRAPTASALLAEGPADGLAELLRPERLRRNPLLDGTAAAALLAKARASGGRLVTEREAMAVTGIATLQLLADQFAGGFAARAAAALRRLAPAPTVCIDAAAPDAPVRQTP